MKIILNEEYYVGNGEIFASGDKFYCIDYVRVSPCRSSRTYLVFCHCLSDESSCWRIVFEGTLKECREFIKDCFKSLR